MNATKGQVIAGIFCKAYKLCDYENQIISSGDDRAFVAPCDQRGAPFDPTRTALAITTLMFRGYRAEPDLRPA